MTDQFEQLIEKEGSGPRGHELDSHQWDSSCSFISFFFYPLLGVRAGTNLDDWVKGAETEKKIKRELQDVVHD